MTKNAPPGVAPRRRVITFPVRWRWRLAQHVAPLGERVGTSLLSPSAALREEKRRNEAIGGERAARAIPSPHHGRVPATIGGPSGEPYERKLGGRHPGGWWIATEVELALNEHQIYRPDVSGWRRERLAELPEESPIRVRPDWVCEVLSRSIPRSDLVERMRVYHRAAVPHYWLVDLDEQILTVYRWMARDYMVALSAERGERVRAEPFVDVELDVEALFGEREDNA